ncbi:MAG: class F sortase [bacterium]|nr:class F sortase [bacterium]
MFSWKRAALLSLGAGLLAVCLSIFVQTRGSAVDAYALPWSASAITLPVVSGTGSSFQMPARPARLIIPKLGVDANIQSVGLSWRGNGDMGVPTNFTDVGWYDKGPRPGMPGSAVIDGHLDGKDVAEAVFYNLGQLARGDIVKVVDAKGKTLEFRVVDVRTYDYDAPTAEIFSNDASKARLNLITCGGNWIKGQQQYDKRIVVFTELVTPD